MAQKVGQTCIFFSMFLLPMITLNTTSTSALTFLADSCLTYPRFQNGSQYESNLNALFNYLISNATTTNGYHQAISGTGNDTIYGHFLCRGDQNATACKDCVTYATNTKLPERCPNRKFAIQWFDECMVRYSYNNFFGDLDYLEWEINYNSTRPIRENSTQFLELRNTTMNNIAKRASDGESKKFATDYVNFTDYITMYGLGQCTPDLSRSDCYICLLNAISLFHEYDGGRVFHFNCIARYEVRPFFDLSTVPSHSPPSPEATTSHEKESVNAKVVISIVISVVAILAVLLALGICFKRKKAKKYEAAVESDKDFKTLESLQYDLDTLQYATNNFSDGNKLGEGGFGGVYKGMLEHKNEVAVKRLSKDSGQGAVEFKNEVLVLAKLQHKNLVRLLGFCLEREEKLLVYEYVPNKSLDYFLSVLEKQQIFDWGIRYKIIGGIARGLLYLHEDSQPTIIHRDLKAGNVLLDEDMNPKIADFGMARIFGVDQTHDNTKRIVGTYGYMSPEYAMHGQFSTKSDVYSFGVIVLEIISGMKNSAFYQLGHADGLVSYAWKQWREDKPMDFVDPTIRDSCTTHEVSRCMHVGLLCVQEAMHDRPAMAKVVRMLEINSISLGEPQEPGFFIRSDKAKSGSTSGIIPSEAMSNTVNDATVTEIQPR